MPVSEQITVLVAVNEGVFDKLSLEEISEREKKIGRTVMKDLPDMCKKIEQGEKLTYSDLDSLRKVAEHEFATQLSRYGRILERLRFQVPKICFS